MPPYSTVRHFVQIFFFLVLINLIEIKADTYKGSNSCLSKVTCHDCIQTPSCAWCSEPAETFGLHPRCYQRASQQLHKVCPQIYEYFPKSSYTVLKQLPLSKGKKGRIGRETSEVRTSYETHHTVSSSNGYSETSYTETTSKIVQVSPQRVKVQLRSHESQSITVQYTQAQDYPVDLYYLMDLSKSMEDDKDKLSYLGNNLASTMKSMTGDFQIGFGSFVDKVVMPYVSTVPSKKLQPCNNCTAPYGYKNHLQLNNDTNQFSDMVRLAQVSGNLDAPEGGFDAIMQAVVCKEKIGWRPNARKLLVFSTDDGFHYAGDGKLGGIIRPNDGLCHLEDNLYSYSKVQDYPSISQLNTKIKQNSINVIFAVTEKQIRIYNELKTHIEGASSGTLSGDSSNVVELVKKQYEEIVSTVEMKDNATGGIVIKYYTKCINSSMSFENNTNTCTGFKVGEVIDFKLDVFLKECPKDPSKWRQTIRVYPIGLSESLFIDLEMLCSCPCEQEGGVGYELNSDKCSGFGTYTCGICECHSLHTGKTCECLPGLFNEKKNATGCRPPGSSDLEPECSGKGVCNCDQCTCDTPDHVNQDITGLWCQCDSFACHRHAGEICGGHGTCECGTCVCEEPWTGLACNCFNSTTSCFPLFKEDPKLCDGHGTCVCGSCQCEETDVGKYTGRFCERCPNCTETCEKLKPCVLCQIYRVGPYDKTECLEKCGNFTPIEVEVVQADELNDEFTCAGYDEDDCRYVFVYKELNETHYEVRAQKDRECPPKVFLLGIVLGVIAAVVLMGLAILLLWKLLTTIHDRREFAKFEKERMMAKWDTGENPIYKQATSTFKNPTYAGKG